MTEQQWNASGDPAAMLEFLTSRAARDVFARLRAKVKGPSERKLRLFACACHPQSDLWKEWAAGKFDGFGAMSAVDGAVYCVGTKVGQHHVVRLDAEEKRRRCDLLRHLFRPFRPVLSRPCGECPVRVGPDGVSRAYCTVCAGRGWLPVEPPTRECLQCQGRGGKAWGRGPRQTIVTQRCGHCNNTGRLPAWPAAVVQLAQALYDGEDCVFALHDALMEAGCPEMAEHFVARLVGDVPNQRLHQWHPKGCAWLDVVLGKE